MFHDLPGLATPRVLLVSLGKAEELSDKTYRYRPAAAKRLADSVAGDAAFCLADAELPTATRLAACPGRTDPAGQHLPLRRPEVEKGRVEERR